MYPLFVIALSAGGGNRTHMPFRTRDFKSRASASFATPALKPSGVHYHIRRGRERRSSGLDLGRVVASCHPEPSAASGREKGPLRGRRPLPRTPHLSEWILRACGLLLGRRKAQNDSPPEKPFPEASASGNGDCVIGFGVAGASPCPTDTGEAPVPPPTVIARRLGSDRSRGARGNLGVTAIAAETPTVGALLWSASPSG